MSWDTLGYWSDGPKSHTMGPLEVSTSANNLPEKYRRVCSCGWKYTSDFIIDVHKASLGHMEDVGAEIPDKEKPVSRPSKRSVTLPWPLICHVLLRRHATVGAACDAVDDMGLSEAFMEALENVVELQHEDDVAVLLGKLTEADSAMRNNFHPDSEIFHTGPASISAEPRSKEEEEALTDKFKLGLSKEQVEKLSKFLAPDSISSTHIREHKLKDEYVSGGLVHPYPFRKKK